MTGEDCLHLDRFVKALPMGLNPVTAAARKGIPIGQLVSILPSDTVEYFKKKHNLAIHDLCKDFSKMVDCTQMSGAEINASPWVEQGYPPQKVALRMSANVVDLFLLECVLHWLPIFFFGTTFQILVREHVSDRTYSCHEAPPILEYFLGRKVDV